MKKIAIVVKSLGDPSIIPIIEKANLFQHKNQDYSLSLLFVENQPPKAVPIFGRFHIADASTFQGVVISTCLDTLRLSKNIAETVENICYLPDIPNEDLPKGVRIIKEFNLEKLISG